MSASPRRPRPDGAQRPHAGSARGSRRRRVNAVVVALILAGLLATLAGGLITALASAAQAAPLSQAPAPR